MKWTRGQETVDRLLAEACLELVTGAATDGTTWLVSAAALFESARRESGRNAEAAYVLAYDAARKESTALVAQQGLRLKSAGTTSRSSRSYAPSSADPSRRSVRYAAGDRRSNTRNAQATTSNRPRQQLQSQLVR